MEIFSGQDPKTAKRSSLALLLLAGVPIITGIFQGVGAILGTHVADWPLVGPVAGYLHGIEIFRLMAIEGEQQPGIVATLFILTGLAWGALGLSMLSQNKKGLLGYSMDDIRSGMTSLSGILYAILFVGAFGNLVFADIPLIQRSVLFFFPAGAIVCIVLARATFPDQGPAIRYANASQMASNRRETFNDEFNDRVGGTEVINRMGHLPGFDPEQLSEINDRRETFLERTDIDDGENVTTHEAVQVEETLKQLSPSNAVDDIERRIRTLLGAYAVDRYGSNQYETPFEDIYELENISETVVLDERGTEGVTELTVTAAGSELETMLEDGTISPEAALNALARIEEAFFGRGETPQIEFRETLVNGTAIPRSVDATEASKYVREAVETGQITPETATTLFDDIETALQGQKGMIRELRRKEAGIAKLIFEAQAQIDAFEETVEDEFRPNVRRNVRRIYTDTDRGDTDHETLSTVSDVRTKLETAKERMQQCRFSRAETEASAANDLGSELRGVLQDLSILKGRVNQKATKVDLPDPERTQYTVYTHDVIQRISPGFRQDYDVSFEIDEDDDIIWLEYGTSSTTGSGEETGRADAGYILNQLYEISRQNDRAVSENEVVASTDGGAIRSSFVSSSSLEYLRDFFDANEQLHGGAEITDGNGRIVIQAAQGKSIESTLKTLNERFDSHETPQHNV